MSLKALTQKNPSVRKVLSNTYHVGINQITKHFQSQGFHNFCLTVDLDA